MQVKDKEYVPTCFDCVNACINPGYPSTFWEPGEPAHLEECKLLDIADIELVDDTGDAERTLAAACGGFEEVKVTGRCIQCRQEITPTPRHLHLWWVYEQHADEAAPCCSEQCRDTKKAYLDALAKSQEGDW